MNKKIPLPIAALILFLLASLVAIGSLLCFRGVDIKGVLLLGREKPESKEQAEEAEIEYDTSDWEIYENKRLGFSIKLPENAPEGFDFSYSGSVSIIDDGESDFVKLGGSYGLEIWITEINSGEDLTYLIKSWSGENCNIVKEKDLESGLYKVNVEGAGEEETIDCEYKLEYLVGRKKEIRYSPELNKVAFTTPRQDCAFSFVSVSPDKEGFFKTSCLDQVIYDTLRLTESP